MEGTIFIPYSNFEAEVIQNKNYTDNNVNENELLSINQILNIDCYNSNDSISDEELNELEKNIKRKESLLYASTKVKINDINNQDENFDNLLNYYKTEENFIEIFFIDLYGLNEDATYELNQWVSSSEKISKTTSQYINDDKKLSMLPFKTFNVNFSKDSNAVFYNCRMIEKYSSSNFAVLIEKIIFTNNK